MAEKNEKHVVYKGLEKSLIEKRAEIKEFTYSLDLFSRKATPNKPNDHRSYVYALCEKVGDSLIPFYIGEGKGPRVWAHELEASEQIKLLEEELNSDEEFTADERLERLEQKKLDLKEKIKKIDEIKRRKGEVVKYIIKWGMTSKEAFMAESALINLLQIGGLKFANRMKHFGLKYSDPNDWVLEDYIRTSYIENFSLVYTSRIKSRLRYNELNDLNYSIYHRRLSILSLDYERYMSRDDKKKKR